MYRCFPMFSGIITRILVNAAIFIISVFSGQECTDTVGSLNHDGNIVPLDQTFILAGYTVPCDKTVVGWEFCYQRVGAIATFYPGIWKITGTNDNRDYALVQSNSITYDASIQTNGTSNDQCQRVNLSVTDQFTAPAGSVVGLYSGTQAQLLHTTNTDSSITTHQFEQDQSSVIAGNDVNYNIAIRVYLDGLDCDDVVNVRGRRTNAEAIDELDCVDTVNVRQRGTNAESTTRQVIVPRFEFSCNGRITGYLISLESDGSSGGYPSVQVWHPTSSTAYTRVDTECALTGNNISNMGDYYLGNVSCNGDNRIEFQSGDVIGYHQGDPLRYRLWTIKNMEYTTYYHAGSNSFTMFDINNDDVASENRQPLIQVMYDIRCNNLSNPNNGQIASCSSGTTGVGYEGDTCNFTCNTSYELTGSDTRTCQSNGSWSGSDDVCRKASNSDTTSITPTTSIVSTSDATTVTLTTSIVSTSDVTISSMMSSTMTSSTAMTTSTMSTMTSSPMISNAMTSVVGSAGSSDNSDGSSIGIIVGCIIGVVLCISLLILVVIFLWYFSRRRKGKVDLSQGTQNNKLAAAQCDMSQKPTCTVDSTDYYSTIADQPYAKQTDNNNLVHKNKVSDYETSLDIFGYEDNKGSNPYSDTTEKSYSKVDYEAIRNPDDYASAAQVYSNYISKSTNYDDTIVSQYSEVEDADGTTANDEEEIYSDPGHSEADIYACFEKKKFRIIKRNDVSFLQKLGSGEFGTVHLGLWTKGSVDPVQVAVKTLNSQCSESDRVKFLREAAIMGQFEGDNIVRLHGVVTEVRDAIIVLEYMSKGDLREFLIDLKNTTPPETLHELKHDFLSYCRHVAAGLNVLSSKGFVHRDLAARNILVSSDDVCKIADFGMARDVADDIYYVTTGGKIPVRWTAPEAIFYKKYSVKSDVWSFGCVMYEIWSLGHKPFEEEDIREYIEKITTGYRLPPPPGCPRAIYELMIKCWHPVAKQRINSSAIVKILQQSDGALLPGAISAKDNEQLSTTLGNPLNTSSNLYQDLQNTYLSTKS